MKNYRITVSEDGVFLHLQCKDGKAYGLNLAACMNDKAAIGKSAFIQWLKENVNRPVKDSALEVEQVEVENG